MTLTPTTRASLLLRLRDPRDHDAWVEFVSVYEPVVYRILRRTGLQDADAAEVLQDLLLAVSRNIERWEHGAEHGSFRGWLGRVTRNLVVSWVRRQKRQVATAPLILIRCWSHRQKIVTRRRVNLIAKCGELYFTWRRKK